MDDFEDMDSFWESWISPGRRKGKKKGTKCLKSKNNFSTNTEEQVPKKKKKNSKYKEAMKGRKDKKKKKKKNRLPFGQDDSAVFTQSSNTHAKQTSSSLSSDKPHPDQLTQDSKKAKKKKKVGFDLSPAYMRVKRPKFVSSTQQSPTESVPLVNKAVRGSESCSHATRLGEAPTLHTDSQSTSDDINSQDLFITQKTFVAPPSQPSSDDAVDKAIKTPPAAATRMEQLHEEPFKSSEDAEFYQHDRKMPEQKPKTSRACKIEGEEEGGLCREGKLSPQSQTQLNTNHTERTKGSRPLYPKPRVMNPYLDKPNVLPSSTEITQSKKHSPVSKQQPPPCLQPSVTSTSTQTENFFTTELSSYLNFCHRRRDVAHFEDLEPLDLSSAQKARKDPGTRDNQHKQCLSCSSHLKDVEVQKKPSYQHPGSVSSGAKAETADTSTSSEDNEQPSRTGRQDQTQVRAVQMKLNESFFFKTKGEGHSPRPESPLMKLAQGSREVKSKKGH